MVRIGNRGHSLIRGIGKKKNTFPSTNQGNQFACSPQNSTLQFLINAPFISVGALVPTHDRKPGEAFFGFFDDFHGHLLIGLPAHHLMVKDELMLILDDVDPESEFHRHYRLALADPLGVGLEDGEDFFMMRDGFVEVHPADDLAHEFFCRAYVLPLFC